VDRSVLMLKSLILAWVDVLAQLVNKNGRETGHHDEQWQQIHVPQLELEVTAWRKIDA
jgi:hypothetical protein